MFADGRQDDVISKPYRIEDMMKKIYQMLGSFGDQ